MQEKENNKVLIGAYILLLLLLISYLLLVFRYNEPINPDKVRKKQTGSLVPGMASDTLITRSIRDSVFTFSESCCEENERLKKQIIKIQKDKLRYKEEAEMFSKKVDELTPNNTYVDSSYDDLPKLIALLEIQSELIYNLIKSDSVASEMIDEQNDQIIEQLKVIGEKDTTIIHLRNAVDSSISRQLVYGDKINRLEKKFRTSQIINFLAAALAIFKIVL